MNATTENNPIAPAVTDPLPESASRNLEKTLRVAWYTEIHVKDIRLSFEAEDVRRSTQAYLAYQTTVKNRRYEVRPYVLKNVLTYEIILLVPVAPDKGFVYSSTLKEGIPDRKSAFQALNEILAMGESSSEDAGPRTFETLASRLAAAATSRLADAPEEREDEIPY